MRMCIYLHNIDLMLRFIKKFLDLFDGVSLPSQYYIKLDDLRAYLSFGLFISLICVIIIVFIELVIPGGIMSILMGSNLIASTLSEDPNAVLTTDSPEFERSVGEEVLIDARNSTGEIEEYQFDLNGDGSIDTITEDGVVLHSYASGGEKNITVTVVDEYNQEDTVTATAQINTVPEVVGSTTEYNESEDELVYTIESTERLNTLDVNMVLPSGTIERLEISDFVESENETVTYTFENSEPNSGEYTFVISSAINTREQEASEIPPPESISIP